MRTLCHLFLFSVVLGTSTACTRPSPNIEEGSDITPVVTKATPPVPQLPLLRGLQPVKFTETPGDRLWVFNLNYPMERVVNRYQQELEGWTAEELDDGSWLLSGRIPGGDYSVVVTINTMKVDAELVSLDGTEEWWCHLMITAPKPPD